MQIYIYFEEEPSEGSQIGEYENENTSVSESDTVNSSENSQDNQKCTLVYTEWGEAVCAESLLEEEETEPVQVEMVVSEEEQEYNETLLNTVKSIESNQQTILQSTDTETALEIYQQIQTELEEIHGYITIFFGLYFIGWIFSQLNNWRRNNK